MTRTQDDYLSEALLLEQPLRAILNCFAPHPADLEDLLHETYSRLFSLAPERRTEIRNVQAFAITTARNIALDWIRRRLVVSIETADDFAHLPAADDIAGLEEIVHTHQQHLCIAAGIAQLSDKCREVFTLSRIYGLTQGEIAERLGITEGLLSNSWCGA
jgi:RNA polymerase sigma-70 factor (ECF subfamily)